MKKLHTIGTLLLCHFIDCACDRNYSLMLVDGEASEEDLKACFMSIYGEFNFMLQEVDQQEEIFLRNRLLYLEAEYNLISSSVYYLRQRFDEEILKILSHYTPEIKFTPKEQETFQKQLDRVHTATLPTWTKSILEAKAELEDYMKQDHLSSEEMNRLHFAKLIVTVSNFVKFHINQHEVTVLEFVSYILSMKKSIEIMNFQNKINLQ